MANFQPIDRAIAQGPQCLLGDPEFRRPVRECLQQLSHHNGSHNYPYCWGYTIFRTVYTPGSDEAFAKAIERLGVYAKNFVDDDILLKPLPNKKARDPLPNQELWSRYYNEVVEDPETLANAGIEEVGKRFDAWVNEHLAPASGKRSAPNARFSLCLMLDQEGIDSILAMPEDPKVGLKGDPDLYRRWVKVVTDEQRPESGRVWFRVGIQGSLWSMWFSMQDPDFMYEEVGWLNGDDQVYNFWGQMYVDYEY
ncbi:uncharacterized protein CTRU02_206147 [Colletotrichum truncatum]|uniref:Uncharacterized protein n=1 Tax=Colletotrichum truncatum TaxID=5467 RepID=A0ACC3Z656_COLTU|nr:uncharacterized protein CTRU02_10436 [Colletotrichum truncatum]KAF6787173.1 hypothetical protein CTRU02_10436 [Colletotrichum truncatum]